MPVVSKEQEKEIIYVKENNPVKWMDTDKLVTLGDLEKEIIKKYKKEKNINFKKPKLFNDEQIKEINKLKKQGLSNVKIAKKMNCSEGTIRNYLKNTQTQ